MYEAPLPPRRHPPCPWPGHDASRGERPAAPRTRPAPTVPRPNANRPRTLAITRYCFTSKLYCGRQSSFYCPPPPAKPTLLQYYCTTIAQHIPSPPTPPCMSYIVQYW